jgi:hypothetical protein
MGAVLLAGVGASGLPDWVNARESRIMAAVFVAACGLAGAAGGHAGIRLRPREGGL